MQRCLLQSLRLPAIHNFLVLRVISSAGCRSSLPQCQRAFDLLEQARAARAEATRAPPAVNCALSWDED
jgi:hypothetical protein